MNKIRAFLVSAPYDDGAVIVFAKSSNQAKSMASGSFEVAGYQYRDLTSERYPKADSYVSKKCAVLWWGVASADRIYYELEWKAYDSDFCDWCGKAEFDTIPESIVSEREEFDWDSVCQRCYEAHKAKEGADE